MYHAGKRTYACRIDLEGCHRHGSSEYYGSSQGLTCNLFAVFLVPLTLIAMHSYPLRSLLERSHFFEVLLRAGMKRFCNPLFHVLEGELLCRRVDGIIILLVFEQVLYHFVYQFRTGIGSRVKSNGKPHHWYILVDTLVRFRLYDSTVVIGILGKPFQDGLIHGHYADIKVGCQLRVSSDWKTAGKETAVEAIVLDALNDLPV